MPEEYESIIAVVDCGTLRWEYQVKDIDLPGRLVHDEDVEHWSRKDIVDVTMSILDVPAHQREIIRVEFA